MHTSGDGCLFCMYIFTHTCTYELFIVCIHTCTHIHIHICTYGSVFFEGLAKTWPGPGSCGHHEPEAPNERAGLGYMMNRNRQKGDVFRIYDEPESPNEGACLRYMINRNRQM